MNRCIVLTAALLLAAGPVFAQDMQGGTPPPDQTQATPDTTPPPDNNTPPPDQTVQQQKPDLTTQPQAPLTQTPQDQTQQQPTITTPENAPPPVPEGAMIDGHLREGAFLSGPGSLAFILHHSIMGAAGGLITQGFANGWKTDVNGREGMLIGTLVGAGIGFGASAWWQFNHWIDYPAAYYGMVNSAASGLFFLGLMSLITQDGTALSWTTLLGAELGAWLTTTIGGGDMPARHGLLMASGAAWGVAYTALLLAIIANSGQGSNWHTGLSVLGMSAGIGAGAMALTTLRYDPSSNQILRADLFGAGVGGAVLVLSALVLGGFNKATPYVLSLLSAAGAMTVVSLLWEESAEKNPNALYRDPELDRPYRRVWW